MPERGGLAMRMIRLGVSALLALSLLGVGGCTAQSASPAVHPLTSSGPAFAMEDGSQAVVGVRGSDGAEVQVAVAVVRMSGDRVVLDVLESDGPGRSGSTASATVLTGQTVALGGQAVRVGIRPPRNDYDRSWTTLELAQGQPDVSPTVPQPKGSAGQPRSVEQGAQGQLQLGGQSVFVGVVNSGSQAIVFSYRTPDETGRHQLVSGDYTTVAGQVVQVESSGSAVTFTPYG